MDEVLAQIPFGPESMAVLVAICGLVSAIVPDSKMPGPVAAVINFLALNFGNARNHPDQG